MAVNPGHNGSTALISDGELIIYIEEERLSRIKYDSNPFRGMEYVLSQYHVDELIICGTRNDWPKLNWSNVNAYEAFYKKYNKEGLVGYQGHFHHKQHAMTAFYNSGFNEALAIIVDGAGSSLKEVDSNNEKMDLPYMAFEGETIFHCSYPDQFIQLHQRLGSNTGPRITLIPGYDIGGGITLTKAYEAVSEYLGFSFIEGGKTMGLAPYGKKNKYLPKLIVEGAGNKNVFLPSYPSGAHIDEGSNPILQRPNSMTQWHKNPDVLTQEAKDLAWAIQNETQVAVGDLIEKARNLKPDVKNIVIAGGYGLNCTANYYLKNKFLDLNIHNEPISHDGGTTIGAAMWIHYQRTQEFKKHPLTSLYLGPKYNKTILNKGLNKYKKKFIQHATTAKDVAKLIANNTIVTIFQGRSEAGPRALGNRSILYNPTDPNGKEFVNKVKNREWFRPFAGTVLKEKAHDWFDLAGMEESPFMMYAVDVLSEKQDQIKAITHVDGTCRVQTVTQEQNKHYYDLIKEFDKITGVPILFNTSFNLAGEPLVETIEDALETMLNSDMKYMYVPELNMLLEKL